MKHLSSRPIALPLSTVTFTALSLLLSPFALQAHAGPARAEGIHYYCDDDFFSFSLTNISEQSVTISSHHTNETLSRIPISSEETYQGKNFKLSLQDQDNATLDFTTHGHTYHFKDCTKEEPTSTTVAAK
ncbi:hypothetical protein [Entomobacter blattae]|uniref:C-type lysozyme inhibitor domain-containing protein n=1 Tax=Entomobacter blattae TaxID=2762277 RepID=A0A7H1NRC9_9PROT|nr:hypothetical protein [Entomobacter blattae]QNT78339.1 hypothetical protein JGUZn3_11120 [Entomobacter blattae]